MVRRTFEFGLRGGVVGFVDLHNISIVLLNLRIFVTRERSSLATHRAAWVSLSWETYLAIAERFSLVPPQMADPSGWIFNKGAVRVLARR